MQKLSKKKLYYGLAAGVVLAAIAVGITVTKHSKSAAIMEEAALVRTEVVGRAAAAQDYTYSGEVKGRFESQLAFQVGGKIIKRHVQLGSVVNAGDVLMEIDAKDVKQTVNSNAAQVYSAESQVKLAENNLNRYQKLFEGGAISAAQLDQYKSAYDVAAASLRQASAQYAQGSNQLDYSVLYADKAGVISSITAEAGQVVTAGQSVVSIVQDGEREVEISVPENRIDEFRNMGQLNVTFWALPGISVDAAVREIAPMADAVSRTYKVRVSLVNPPAEVKLGMTSTVTAANRGKQQDAAYIPLTAIYQTSDVPGVWVLNNEIVTLRHIKIGAVGNGKVQVLEGLQNDDVIVTAGVHKLKEGQKVRIAGDTL
ncbi:efflux RND transporter periplasmic adaptor subunit [Pelosinus propionicus]|uniref:RND family efflux transporter, MFP subunit n=1 Tax=Pelosinus propionicus DSM 13327 TaxID=1123291 RepID=A0A1I4IYF5_9FIRM|nr:efflux RND transporter periplasmic adaptor subunit [Pelosinus propionicus]SFL59300.1 RND family efflux transporter, MFP subunit [Pelosinus propionicus DSM 13327]